MNLESYALLNKPVAVLGLSPASLAFLKRAGIEDISSLLDQDWAAYPMKISDEIRRVATKRGLIELSEPDPADRPLTQSELVEREWDHLVDETGKRAQISYVGFRESDALGDPELLAKHPRFPMLNDLWVEHWIPSDQRENDFRAWSDLFERYPSRLRSLEFGTATYSSASNSAKLGSLAGTVGGLRQLRKLVLCGAMISVEPFPKEELTSFRVDTVAWPEAAIEDFVKGTTFASLKTISVNVAQPSDAAALSTLLGRRHLRDARLFGFQLTPQFFARLQASGRGEALRSIALWGCNWPTETGAEAALVDSIVACSDTLNGVLIQLPPDAKDTQHALQAAGLGCEFVEEGTVS